MKPAIKITNLTKYYDDFLALDHIDLTVNQGEVFGFIGKNGAGKTTTINLVLSLLHADDGKIEILGKPIIDKRTYKYDIGYVPDVPVFPHYLTAREYLTYTCDMLEYTVNEKSLIDTLDFVGLKETTKQVGSFSRGMKQRLAIAQALVHDPEILLMDEPTSALDPIGRKDVLDIILKLKGKKTIFYSTHILEDAEKVCDRIGLIDHGQIKLVKSIMDIKNDFIQPMMIIDARNSDKLISSLSALEYIKSYRKHPQGVLVEFTSSIENNTVLKDLMSKDIVITRYVPYLPSLEDVFIEVTS
ncbi:MAG: ABC transporter ATP-binding protein [Candidatus Izemoplasma sp.]|nr:ABC transporter ATP-binding protein [Candidatus Izemoplasma sp.]